MTLKPHLLRKRTAYIVRKAVGVKDGPQFNIKLIKKNHKTKAVAATPIDVWRKSFKGYRGDYLQVRPHWFVGLVVTHNVPKTLRVMVNHYITQPKTLLKLKRSRRYPVHDEHAVCRPGDVILFKTLPHVRENKAKGVVKKHGVVEIIRASPQLKISRRTRRPIAWSTKSMARNRSSPAHQP
eukprot:54117_1